MDIIHSFEQLNIQKKAAVAVGYFDGMHLGHRKLIREMIDYAKENDSTPVVLTFDMTELRAEGKGSLDLFPRSYTIRKADEMGVEAFIEIPFGQIKDMDPESFCKTVLKGRSHLDSAAVFCGKKFAFGKERSGSLADLERYGKKYGYVSFGVDEVMLDGEVVSTTRIKQLIQDGEIERANEMLGDVYSLSGKVIHGNHLAHELGFPTANILLPNRTVSPKKGVYLTETVIDDEMYRSITNIGTRPTVTDDAITTAETHMLDYDADIYGKTITIYFFSFIREEKRFASVQELKQTVQMNIEQARQADLELATKL